MFASCGGLVTLDVGKYYFKIIIYTRKVTSRNDEFVSEDLSYKAMSSIWMVVCAQSQNIVTEKYSERFSMVKHLMLFHWPSTIH